MNKSKSLQNKQGKKKFNKKSGNPMYREDLKEEADETKGSADLKNHSKYGNPNWYFTDKELAEQASRFSFQSYIGNGELTDNATLPSIMTCYMHPSVGGYVGVTQDYDPDEDNASVQAVNLMARKLYSRMSAMSGRTASYQPQDIMFAILGIGEVISIVSHLRRVIGLAFTYNYRNRDFPSNIIKAMGVNPDDLFANLSRYRVEFNTILNMANKIPILANVTWFEKCSKIYEGIFQDSNDEMAQMYIMLPGSTWIINELGSEEGTVLKTLPFTIDLQNDVPYYKNFSEYLNMLRQMINALLTSTTFNIIYSDILQLSSKQNVPLMQLDLVREDYGVIPQYDPEFLLHIHNMNVYSLSRPDYYQNTKADLTGRSISNCNDVFQDVESNNIMYAPAFYIWGANTLTDVGVTLDPVARIIEAADLVDFPYGNPDLTERIEASRFSIRLNMDEIFNGESEGQVYAYAKTLPDHFCTQINMWISGESGASNRLRTTLNSSSGAKLFSDIEKFRYAPLVYNFNSDGHVFIVFGDVNYFTHIDGKWLKRLNSLCLQGLLELR